MYIDKNTKRLFIDRRIENRKIYEIVVCSYNTDRIECQ